LKKLELENKELKETTEKLSSIHKKAMELVNGLTGMDKSAKYMAEASEKISETGDGLNKSLHKLDNILEKLKKSKFKIFDKNKDGYITEDEWSKGIETL